MIFKIALLITTILFVGNSHAQLWQQKDLDKIATTIVSKQLEAERSMYSVIPDPLNCKKLIWMKRKQCETMNFLMKRNPSAPMRMISKNGIEVNIPPGTPSSIISYVLDPTVENSLEYKKFSKQVLEDDKNKKRLSSVVAEISKGISHKETSTFMKDIDQSNVRVTAIINADDTSSHNILQNLKEIKSKYSNISVSVFFAKGSQSNIRNYNDLYEFNGKAMTLAQHAKAKVGVYPTTWVDNKSFRFRRIIEHTPSIPQLVNLIEVVSNAHLAKEILGEEL